MLEKCNEIRKIWNYMKGHPLSRGGVKGKGVYLRFLYWQIIGKRIFKKGRVIPWINGSRLFMFPGLSSVTGNYYYGIYEFEAQSFLLHYACEADFFVDIGANAGVYTVMLGKIVRKVVAFEPSKDTIKYLKKNIRINDFHNVKIVEKGVSNKGGKVYFTKGLGCMNHIVESSNVKEKDVEIIETISLDEYLVNDCPNIIKIDVEGAEKEILEGAKSILSNIHLNVVIMEIFDDEYLEKTMGAYGFGLYEYDAFNRKLTPTTTKKTGNNGIFIRNIKMAEERIHSAKPICVNKWSI